MIIEPVLVTEEKNTIIKRKWKAMRLNLFKKAATPDIYEWAANLNDPKMLPTIHPTAVHPPIQNSTGIEQAVAV